MRAGLTSRTIAVSVLLGVVIVGGFGLTTAAVQGLRGAARASLRSSQALVVANQLERRVIDIQTGYRGYLITLEPSFLRPYRAGLVTYPPLLRQLSGLTAGTPGLAEQVSGISRAVNAYVRDWARPIVHLAASGSVAAARKAVANGNGKLRVDAIRARLQVFTAAETRLVHARVASADHLGAVAFALCITGMAVSGAVVALVSFGVQRTIVKPLRRLAGCAARLATGNLSARVPAGGAAEVGDLTAGFNAMAGNLEKDTEALQSQQEELARQQAELARALGVTEQQKARSDLLRRFGDRLAATSDVDEVSEAALQGMADSAEAEIGALYLIDESSHRFQPVARRGLAEAAEDVAAGEGLAGRALAERRPVQVAGQAATSKVAGVAGTRTAGRELHLPLVYGDRPVGVVSLGRALDKPFTASDLALVGDLAEQAAVACAEALSVQRVKQAARELDAVLSATDEGIYKVSRDGTATMVNQATLDQTGYTRQELLGRNMHEILHHSRGDGTLYPRAECPVQQVFATGNGARVANEVYWRKDGTPFPIEYSCYPLRQDGVITGVVISFFDISHRKLAERQRDTQHAVTRVLAAAAGGDVWDKAMAAACEGLRLPIGIGWLAAERGTRLRHVLTHATSGFGDMAAQLTQASLAAGEGLAGQALSRREPVTFQDLARQQPRPGSPAGSRLHGAIAIPALGSNGRVLAVAEFFADRDLAEPGLLGTLVALAGQCAQYIENTRAREATQRMRDQFVATVSHELRTPLTSIDGWLHVLLGEEPGPLTSEQQHFLAIVKQNSERLLRLVGDLLLAGQIESGKLTLEFADVDVAELARQTAELVSAQAAAKQVTLTVCADEPSVVRGDRARLIQLLDNLLSNAVKFTPAKGSVGLTVASLGGICRVEVSDTGIGVPAEDRSHLFQRFFRASSATSRGIAGTGIGLAICKAVAEGHHGTVYLAEREGPGSLFVVEVPLSAHQEAAS